MSKKNVLIVFVHPDPTKSFNAALKKVAIETLEKEGHSVEVSDLYGQHYNPVASKADFTGPLKNHENFSYLPESGNGYENGTLTADIVGEQAKLTRADLVIFQFPMHWFSVPAMLKGYFDRIFAPGFTHTFPNHIYDEGLMKGKRAVLSFTTGSTGDMFTSKGLQGDINVVLYPIHYGTLRFCGFDVLKPQMSFGPEYTDDAGRKTLISDWAARLNTIFEERPIPFISVTNFDLMKGFVMSDECLERESKQTTAPTVAHHLGKPIPSKR